MTCRSYRRGIVASRIRRISINRHARIPRRQGMRTLSPASGLLRNAESFHRFPQKQPDPRSLSRLFVASLSRSTRNESEKLHFAEDDTDFSGSFSQNAPPRWNGSAPRNLCSVAKNGHIRNGRLPSHCVLRSRMAVCLTCFQCSQDPLGRRWPDNGMVFIS